jgi:hypothetical protein
MAFYLVRARPNEARLIELARQLRAGAFVRLEPFGRTLTESLCRARRAGDGRAVWEEEDYCRPPLAEERSAVLDHYFDDIVVEPVRQGAGWQQIEGLPPLFPDLAVDREAGTPRAR